MIRLTIYIILAIMLALGAAWMTTNPGQILITWQGWEVRFSMAVMVLLVLFYTVMLWFTVWLFKKLNISTYFTDPKRLAAKRKKGENDLDLAWSAFALEEYKAAIKFGLRAKSKLGENGSVLRLLASATSKIGESKNPYLDALKASSASMVWVDKQQLDHYLYQRSWGDAAPLVQKMLDSHPNNKELLKLAFLLLARLGNWQEAKLALLNARREKGAMTPSMYKHYSAVIDYCLAQEKKAAGSKMESLNLLKSSLKSDPMFAPAALSAARLYIEQDDRKSAEKILTAIWKQAPNAELSETIAELYPQESSGETFRRIKKITEPASDFSESHHLLASVAIDSEQWPDARRALESIINSNMASKTTYQTLALLERKQKSDKKASDKFIEKSENTKADNYWQCNDCHKIFPHYLPTCTHCHEFDSIEWSR